MLLYRSTHRAHTRGRHRLHPDRNGSDGCCSPTYRPETLVDFGAVPVGAAAVAFYTPMFVWTVGLVLYEVLLSAPERVGDIPRDSLALAPVEELRPGPGGDRNTRSVGHRSERDAD